MKILSRLFSAAALIGLASTAANATSIIGYNATQAASTSSGFSLTLNKFNTGYGTLNSVTIYFLAQINESNITITSTDGTSTQVFDYSLNDNLTKTFVNSATAANILTGENIQVFDTGIGGALGNCTTNPSTTVPVSSTLGCNGITLGPDATTGNLGGYSLANTNSSYGLTTGTGTNGLVGVTISGTTLANYMTSGSGTFTLSGTSQGGSSSDEQGAGSTNANFVSNSTTQFAAEVDYGYTSAAPEPGTMMLLGSALVGVGLVRSRRSKKA